MIVNLMITRHGEWVWEQRIERGENVPLEIAVDVKVDDLTVEARTALLRFGGGAYPTSGKFRLCFDQRYQPNPHASGYGTLPIEIDADAPSTEALSQALVGAWEELEGKRDRYKREQSKLAAAQAQAAEEDKLRLARLAEARMLLASELEDLSRSLKSARDDRQTLSEFLSGMSEETLRTALEEVAEPRVTAKRKLLERVEAASSRRVFGFDLDDEE